MSEPTQVAALRIFRWQVPVDDQVHLIGGGRVVRVATAVRPAGQTSANLMDVWTIERPDLTRPDERALVGDQRATLVVGTGHPLPDSGNDGGDVDLVDVLGSDRDGPFVWHVLEVRRASKAAKP